MEVRRQFRETVSLLPPHGLQGWNSGHQAEPGVELRLSGSATSTFAHLVDSLMIIL